MKLAIGYRGNAHRQCDSEFESIDDCFLADVDVPLEVERAAEMTDHIWLKNYKAPYAVADKGRLTIKNGVSDVAGKYRFCRSNITAIISLGGRKEEGSKQWDFSHPESFQISVYAMRQFFPTTWKTMIPENVPDSFDKSDRRAVTPVKEIVNISLNWNGYEYDDWSNPEEWEITRKYGAPVKKFDPNKTTYCASVPYYVGIVGSARPLEKRKAAGVVRQQGREEPLIEQLSPELLPFAKQGEKEGWYEHGNNILEDVYDHGVLLRMPIVGLKNVSQAMGSYISFQSPDTMSRIDGIEYLFCDVLSDLVRFIAYE